MKIWMVNEIYVNECGRITEKLHNVAFIHREKASEYASRTIDELCDLYNRYSTLRGEEKEYRVVSKTLYSATIRPKYTEIEKLTLETIPINLDES